MKQRTIRYRKSQQMSPARAPQSNAYERLSQRLEELAEREGRYSNADKIALLRQAAFADVEKFVQSGQLVLPKYNHGS